MSREPRYVSDGRQLPDDAGPAFPGGAEAGMSLRDWFAGQVAGATFSGLGPKGDVSRAATQAYAMADALLAVRETPLPAPPPAAPAPDAPAAVVTFAQPTLLQRLLGRKP